MSPPTMAATPLATGDGTTDDTTTDAAADDSATDATVDGGDDDTDTGDGTPTDDGAAPGDDTSSDDGTGGQVKPPAEEVAVLVANDTTVGGLAGTVTNQLTAVAYATLTPTNTSTQGADATAPSVVYFQPGYRPDAIAVAAILGLPETSIAEMPETPPVADLGRANLLVVVGADLVPAA